MNNYDDYTVPSVSPNKICELNTRNEIVSGPVFSTCINYNCEIIEQSCRSRTSNGTRTQRSTTSKQIYIAASRKHYTLAFTTNFASRRDPEFRVSARFPSRLPITEALASEAARSDFEREGYFRALSRAIPSFPSLKGVRNPPRETFRSRTLESSPSPFSPSPQVRRAASPVRPASFRPFVSLTYFK